MVSLIICEAAGGPLPRRNSHCIAPGGVSARGCNPGGVPRCECARPGGLLALIETPEAMEGHLLRARGQDDARRRAQRCLEVVQQASRLAAGRGWLP
jgi:hypothetical protein